MLAGGWRILESGKRGRKHVRRRIVFDCFGDYISCRANWYRVRAKRPSASRQVFERVRRLVLIFAQFERAEPGSLFLGVRRWLHHDKSGAGMFGPNPKVVRSDLNCPVTEVITARIDRHSELLLCQLHHVGLAIPFTCDQAWRAQANGLRLARAWAGQPAAECGASFPRAGDRRNYRPCKSRAFRPMPTRRC